MVSKENRIRSNSCLSTSATVGRRLSSLEASLAPPCSLRPLPSASSSLHARVKDDASSFSVRHQIRHGLSLQGPATLFAKQRKLPMILEGLQVTRLSPALHVAQPAVAEEPGGQGRPLTAAVGALRAA